ncbi:MAG TPA: hypothetical protein VEX38_06855 [Fimbriimonadaceae bacterium]|nr:hypothetical protein [Fimbriimonadaceae bacterium]
MHLLSRAVCLAALLVFGSATASAQLSRWQLGNPSLILDLPGNPSAGGVAWAQTGLMAILPTSWSSESADLRAEVAYNYTSESPSAMAAGLGAELGFSVENLSQSQLSGYPAAFYSLKGRPAASILADGKGWTVLLTPKTSAGVQQAQEVLRSMVLERSGSPRWVRRSLGNTKLVAELPYEPAPRPGRSTEKRAVFELHFADYAVEGSVEQAGEGMEINYEGTVKGFIEREKSRPETKNFTSKRERIQRDRMKGDLVTLEFDRGNKKARFIAAFVLDGNQLVRLDITEDRSTTEHEGFSSRIVQSLQMALVRLNGFVPQQVGAEGVWLDSPKPFESAGGTAELRRYGVFGGAFAVDVRVQALPEEVKQNYDQFVSIQQAALTPSGKVKELSSDVTKRLIDGIDARVLRLKYKEAGRGDFTNRVALVIFLPDRTFVADMIANEEQTAYLERIIETARVEMPTPAGWSRHALGEGSLSVLLPAAPKNEKFDKPYSGVDYAVLSEFDAPGLIGELQEHKYTGAVPLPSLILRNQINRLKEVLKTEVKLTDQRLYDVGGRSGVLGDIEIQTKSGNVAPGNVLILKGRDRAFIIVLINDASRPNHLSRAIVLNSLR